jgi:hypothetical protein
MKVERLEFSSPVLCIDDFLLDEEANAIFQECVELKKLYVPASIFDGTNSTKINTDYRSNSVLYVDEVFKNCPEKSDILTILKKRVWTEECRTVWHDGYYIFDIINYATSHEIVISYYGDANFYKRHQDTRWDLITSRLVTLIYYVNTIPTQFEGGALTIWHDDRNISIESRYNRAIIFPSFMFHGVEGVRMNSNQWIDGRFSINYWMGFK